MRFSLLLLLLLGCSHKPPFPEKSPRLDNVAVFSRIGNSFVVSLHSHSLLRAKETVLDIAAWKLDQNFAEQFREGVRERRGSFVDFLPDPASVESALKVRESRWKRIEGKESQALLDFLLKSAEEKGAWYLFLLSPEQKREKFLLHQGEVGAYCNDREKGLGQAYIYFFFRFSIWNVAERRKIFEQSVDPSASEAISLGGCNLIADLKDPLQQLEDPVKKTSGLIVEALFDKFGWKRPGQ